MDLHHGQLCCRQEGNNNSFDEEGHDDGDDTLTRMDMSTIEMDEDEEQEQEQDHQRSHYRSSSRLNLESSTCHDASIGQRESCCGTAMMIIDNTIHENFAGTDGASTDVSTSAAAAVLFNPEHTRFDSDALSSILSFLDLAALTNLQATSTKLFDTVALAATHLFVPVSYLNHRHHHSITTSTYKYRGGLYEQEVVLPLEASSERSGLSSSSPPPASKTPQDQLRCLLRRYPNLTFLAIDRVAPVGDEVIQIINECPSRMTLTSLSLSNLALSYWCRHSLHLPNLNHLSLTGNSVRARIVNVIRDTTVYQNLQSLCIQDCNTAIRDDDMIDLSRQLGHSLKVLQMRNAKLSNPKANFPRLETLKLCGCFHLKSLSNFNCPNLVELNLSFCVKLTGQAISSFIEPPSPLPSSRDKTNTRMKNLKSLTLMKCLPDSLILSKGTTSLSCIKIDFCHNLKNMQLVCPDLSVFEVRTGKRKRKENWS